VSFIRTGLRELGLKIRRQRTRMALRHEKRLLQKSEINLGREGCAQAVNFPEVRSEIVALKKLEQEQKEVALRIAQLEEGIRQIEAQRQQNTKEQNKALAALEEEKKPISRRRDSAQTVADRCSNELVGVERRLQENDAADRDLLKQLADLQARVPPPADLETQISDLTSRRALLPRERIEIERARIGTAEASRQAKDTLKSVQAELDVAEKNISRVRGEFEAREKELNDKNRTQQEAIREARQHHQTVEERKNPAYLNIGQHLASKGIAPPNAPNLLKEVQRHREAVQRHLAHTAELATLSSRIDKQDLRKFYFSIISVLVLMAIILPLVFRSAPKHEWLPQETETILSLNTDQLDRADVLKRWRKEADNNWQNVWSGLLDNATRVPILENTADLLRVTRAMTTTTAGTVRDFILLEARSDLSRMVRSIDKDQGFERQMISGLPLWKKNGLAVGRVGPRTIAVGRVEEVDELIQVRIGQKPDLKTGSQFYDRYQALNQDSALRLISRDPSNLPHFFQPIFPRELLDSCQLLGLSLNLQGAPRARLLIRSRSAAQATGLSQRLRSEPQRWLHLQDSELLLYEQAPEVSRQDENIEARFTVPETSVRQLLQRLARTDGAVPVTVP